VKLERVKRSPLLFSSFKKLLVISLSTALSISLLALPSEANEYSCLQDPQLLTEDPIWSTSGNKDLKFVVSWAFKDPENCIVGMHDKGEIFGDSNIFRWNWNLPGEFMFPATWTVTRAGEMSLVSAETEFPIPLLQALPNRNLNGYGFDLSQLSQNYTVSTYLKTRKGSNFGIASVSGKYGIAQLWGNWFSKNQGIFPDQCKPISPDYDMTKLNAKVSWKVLKAGPKPTVEISIHEDSNCIFLVHAGPLVKPSGLNQNDAPQISLAERPFWSGEAPPYFNQILSKPDQLVQIAVGEFTGEALRALGLGYGAEDSDTDIVKTLPSKILSHSDSVIRDGQNVKVTTTIDLANFSSASPDIITIYTGFYWWYSRDSSYTSAGWRVNYSGNSWTARYSPGGSLPGGVFMGYTARAVKIPIADLLTSAADKAKIKSEIDARINSAKSQFSDLSAEIDSLVKLSPSQKAKLISYKIDISPFKSINESNIGNAEIDILRTSIKVTELKINYLKNSKTITCANGKKSIKVKDVKPSCPPGYKKR
jgi:hypothetical protein